MQTLLSNSILISDENESEIENELLTNLILVTVSDRGGVLEGVRESQINVEYPVIVQIQREPYFRVPILYAIYRVEHSTGDEHFAEFLMIQTDVPNVLDL